MLFPWLRENLESLNLELLNWSTLRRRHRNTRHLIEQHDAPVDRRMRRQQICQSALAIVESPPQAIGKKQVRRAAARLLVRETGIADLLQRSRQAARVAGILRGSGVGQVF